MSGMRSPSDLLQVVQPFGAVGKLVMLHTKDQALVRMEDLASLASAIQYYTMIQPSMRGRKVDILAVSSHQELTTVQSSRGRNPDQLKSLWTETKGERRQPNVRRKDCNAQACLKRRHTVAPQPLVIHKSRVSHTQGARSHV